MMDSQPSSLSAPTGEIVVADGDGDSDKFWYNDDLDLSNSMLLELEDSDRSWSRQEDKIFENAIASLPKDTPDPWERIAMLLPGRTGEEVRARYDKLVEDLEAIVSGKATPPRYDDDCSPSLQRRIMPPRPNKSRVVISRKKEEHRLFLEGLEEVGKGCWREISRKYVKTKSPSQVASHAQKFFIRQSQINSNAATKRKSIHDITLTTDRSEEDANT